MADGITAQIKTYIGCVLAHPDADDEDVAKALMQSGLGQYRAFELLVWMPMAFGRALLAVGFALMYAYAPKQDPPDDSALIVGGLVMFFLVGAVLCFMMLSPDRNHLLLTPTDFTFRTVLKRRNFRWEEVEEFHTMSVKGTTMVIYSLSPQGRLPLWIGYGESSIKLSAVAKSVFPIPMG